MNQSIETSPQRPERKVRLWRAAATAAVVATTLAWLGGGLGPGRIEAQSARAGRAEPASRTRFEFRQAEVVYTRLAELIGEWESKGWETFQVVPVFPANPGIGRPMTVAVVFRRATR
jgi:hypothetical protein